MGLPGKDGGHLDGTGPLQVAVNGRAVRATVHITPLVAVWMEISRRLTLREVQRRIGRPGTTSRMLPSLMATWRCRGGDSAALESGREATDALCGVRACVFGSTFACFRRGEPPRPKRGTILSLLGFSWVLSHPTRLDERLMKARVREGFPHVSKLLLMSLMMQGKGGALAKFYQGLLGVVDCIHGM